MIEENKFKEVDSIQLYNDNIGYVKLYDASNANESEKQRQYTVATISSLAYGNEEAKYPDKLYKKLQQLGHESLAEFVREGYGSCDINSSMRTQPKLYKENYIHNVTRHKENIACFRIKVPIFVARQFMRHRSFSYLEMSRRYTKGSKVPFEFWFPEDFSSVNKNHIVRDYLMGYELLCNEGYETQVASRFLPQTTYTEFYVMGEVEGLKNFFKLRLDSHAQAQIRAVSEAMLELLIRHQLELANKVRVKD